MSTRFLPVIATVPVASVSVPGTSIANPLAGSFATWRRRRSGGRFFASPIAFSARNGGRGRFDGSLHRRETLGQFSIDLNLKKKHLYNCVIQIIRVCVESTWIGTGIRGKRLSYQSNFVSNWRTIVPIVIGWPPPAFGSISWKRNKERQFSLIRFRDG